MQLMRIKRFLYLEFFSFFFTLRFSAPSQNPCFFSTRFQSNLFTPGASHGWEHQSFCQRIVFQSQNKKEKQIFVCIRGEKNWQRICANPISVGYHVVISQDIFWQFEYHCGQKAISAGDRSVMSSQAKTKLVDAKYTKNKFQSKLCKKKHFFCFLFTWLFSWKGPYLSVPVCVSVTAEAGRQPDRAAAAAAPADSGCPLRCRCRCAASPPPASPSGCLSLRGY